MTSRNILMEALFPRSQNVTWRGDLPAAIFHGTRILAPEELSSMVDFANNHEKVSQSYFVQSDRE